MPFDEGEADDVPFNTQLRSVQTSRNVSDVYPPLESPFNTVPAARVAPTTTNTKLDAITCETEPRQKATGLTVTIHDGLTSTRGAVIDDTGPTIPEIPDHLFFSVVLPQPPILEHTQVIYAALSNGSRPKYNSKRRRWSAFPRDPAKAKLKENAVYQRLERIYDAVLNAASTHCPTERPVTTFRNTPDFIPKGTWRNSTSKPDGFFALRDRRAGGSPHWMDIVATGEYKRDDNNVRNLEDDSKKVLWNMHQTMRNDPCRRFTFGFTIENREMRIWYASRADILVSTPFDFMHEPLLLIKFFLMFTFADVYSLGWDPTMRCEWRGPDAIPHYIITVRSEETGEEVEYRAKDILSNVSADALRGRGTRVFRVRKVENGVEVGGELVLKDCWMDADRIREGGIMADILQDAAGTPQEAVLKSGLLTVVMHGDVHINGELDRTISKDERRQLFAEDSLFLVHRSDANKEKFNGLLKRGLEERAVKGSHLSKSDYIHKSSLGPIMYCPKKHYRIVFKEACKPLFSEDILSRIFYILGQTCKILMALHEIGWVHRDISSGNILTDGDVVKLADLEYAKKIGKTTGGHHEIRTGTADFMSIEVFRMDYMFVFNPGKNAACVTRNKDIEAGWDVYAPTIALNPDPEPRRRPGAISWYYNPLHDLESVFWLIAYYVLSRDIYLPDGLDWPPPFKPESNTARAARIKAQYQFIEFLFIRRDPPSRIHLLNSFEHLKQQLEEAPLHPVLFTIGNRLVAARDALQRQFMLAETTLPIPLSEAPTIADTLHKEFGSFLHDMRQALLKNGVFDVRCRPLSAVYEIMEAHEEVEKDEKKKAMYKRTATARREIAEKEARLARESGIIVEDIAGLDDSPRSDIPAIGGVRRSQRIASRGVKLAMIVEEEEEDGEDGEEGEEESGDQLRRSRRKPAKKPTIRATTGKRKRGNDEYDATAGPSRKVPREANNASKPLASLANAASRPKRAPRQRYSPAQALLPRPTKNKNVADHTARPKAANNKPGRRVTLRSQTRT